MKSIQRKVETLFHNTLKTQLAGIDRPLKIFAAFSGGPDSTALLFLLKQYQAEFSYTLEAAYVNHGIRPAMETADEDASVLKVSSEWMIPLHIKKLCHGFLAYYSHKFNSGEEAAARLYRYHFFNRLKEKSEGKAILALGHNRNDQEETIIMRLFTGAGIEGLKGIPEHSDSLIRPLIHIDRDSIMQYLASHGLRYVHDSSNFNNEYLRNKIRLDLMGQLETIFPGGSESLIRLSHETAAILNHYNELTDKICPWKEKQGAWSCLISDFLKLPGVTRRSMILKYMNKLLDSGGADRRIPRNFFNPVEGPIDNRSILLQGHGIVLSREREQFVLKKLKKPKVWEHFFFSLTEKMSYDSDNFTLEMKACRDVLPDQKILILPESLNSLIIRSPQSSSEVAQYSFHGKEPHTFICSGKDVLFVLSPTAEILFTWSEYKKRFENDSDTNHLCVIIIDRGKYARG